MFDSLHLGADPTLMRLYQQHNGVCHLDAFAHFLPVEDAARCYASFAGFKADWPDFEWMPGRSRYSTSMATSRSASIFNPAVWSPLTMKEAASGCASHYGAYVDALYEVFLSGGYAYEPTSGSIKVDPTCWKAVAERHGIVGLGDVW